MNWGRRPGGAPFAANIAKEENGGARLTHQAELVKTFGRRRQRVGPKGHRRITPPNLSGTACPRYRQQMGYLAPPNGGDSYRMIILRVSEILT